MTFRRLLIGLSLSAGLVIVVRLAMICIQMAVLQGQDAAARTGTRKHLEQVLIAIETFEAANQADEDPADFEGER